MKILQITPIFLEEFGGVSTVVRHISKELAKEHDVTVYTTVALGSKIDNGPRFLDIYLDNYRVVAFSRSFNGFLRDFYISTELDKAMKDNLKAYDIVHIHSWRQYPSIVLRYYAKKYGVPYVLQAHGSLPRIMAWRRLKWFYDVLFGYRLLRDASKVVALSQVEAQQYKAMGVTEEKIAIIPNGIDLSEYAKLPPKGAFKKKFNIDEDEKVVLYLGRIHESKGLGLLADAFSVVCKDINNARLVVVGPDDGYAATFSRRISDLEIKGKVLLTGFVEKRDKLAALIDSDVFVTPRFYGFPVTFLEACLAGCPIVTTSNELNWIHNNVGYVVESSSIALAKAISNILRDEGTRERFRNNCKSAIKNFDISTVVSQLEDTYKSVVS